MSNILLTMKRNLVREQELQELTDEELAKRARLSVPTIRTYKSFYQDGVKIENWLALSRALGHDGLDWLMKDETELTKHTLDDESDQMVALSFLYKLLKKTRISIGNATYRKNNSEEIHNLRKRAQVLEWLTDLVVKHG